HARRRSSRGRRVSRGNRSRSGSLGRVRGGEMERGTNMLRRIPFLVLAVAFCSPLAAEERVAKLRFELVFPAAVRTEPADGRVFVILTRKPEPEPRLQFGKSGGQYRSTPFFGEDVDGFKPGQRAVIDGRSIGYPVERLADLPSGDYYVQGMLSVYTTFHRADGHVLKMHMDQWE